MKNWPPGRQNETNASTPLEINRTLSGAVLFDARDVEQVRKVKKWREKIPATSSYRGDFAHEPRLALFENQ
jgi:hypothetical protein